MAVQYYGIDRGAARSTVTTDTSTLSKDVEIAVDLASSITRGEVEVKVRELLDYIMEQRTSPFAQ